MVAIILGSTGMIGSLLIKELMSADRYDKIISITRKSLNISDKKLYEIFIQDLFELKDINLGIEDSVFFCCIGTTIKKACSRENFIKVDYWAVHDFAMLAIRSRASKFVLVSSMGSNPNSLLFYNKTKGEAERSVINLNLKNVTVFRPGLLLGEREDSRLAEYLFIRLTNLLSKVISQRIIKKFATKGGQLAHAMVKDSMVLETGYKVVESSET